MRTKQGDTWKMTITFEHETQPQIDPGYQQALHTLNEYFGGDAEHEVEDMRFMTTMWHGRKCTCGGCADCWLFTSQQGPLAFWVHGAKVAQYSLQGDSIEVTHNAVAA